MHSDTSIPSYGELQVPRKIVCNIARFCEIEIIFDEKTLPTRGFRTVIYGGARVLQFTRSYITPSASHLGAASGRPVGRSDISPVKKKIGQKTSSYNVS